MQIHFYKYQGTGNDFVMIDNRDYHFDKDDTKLIARFCDRKFGVGADGLILLEEYDQYDFKMVYYNADGHQSSMCGNGGRCLVHFAKHLGIIANKASFVAIDGVHNATIQGDTVTLGMSTITGIEHHNTYYYLNTGSPHHVQEVTALSKYPVYQDGKRLRNEMYGKEGSNINFVEKLDAKTFKARTYERGVEDETLSCGTGVTAVAIAMHERYGDGKDGENTIKIEQPGGTLHVQFHKVGEEYRMVKLIGPATQVFEGTFHT